MTDKPTIEQVLSDPRSGDRAALDYCNEEVRNCLDKADELRKENAALWAFVRAYDNWWALPESNDLARLITLDVRMERARDALRQYEGGDR